MVEYFKVGERGHLLCSQADRNKVEINLIFTAGGGYFESPDEKGLAHYLEHCIVSRTKKLNFYQLKDYLFEYDIYSNASTGHEIINLTVSGHKSEVERMLDLIFEFAFEPTIDIESLEREREVILREISQRNGDPGYILQKKVTEEIFEPGSVSLNDILGEEKNIRNASVKSLTSLHNKILKCSHIILSISGNFGGKTGILKKFETHLSQISALEGLIPLAYPLIDIYKNFKRKVIVDELAHEHSILNLMIPANISLQNRAQRVFILDLFLRVPDGLLYNRLRNELGYIYGLHAIFDLNSSVLNINMACEVQFINQIIEESRKFLSDFDKYFDKDKARILKATSIKRQDISLDDPEQGLGFTLNNLIDYGEPLTFDKYCENFRSVSEDSIHETYDEIKSGLDESKVVIVTKNEAV